MSFNYSEISDDFAIKIGSDDAPLKVVEYINLRCPDSKAYEENVAPFLNNYIENGTVQRVLKHFDKQTIYLELGNILNQYLDYSTPKKRTKRFKNYSKTKMTGVINVLQTCLTLQLSMAYLYKLTTACKHTVSRRKLKQ